LIEKSYVKWRCELCTFCKGCGVFKQSPKSL